MNFNILMILIFLTASCSVVLYIIEFYSFPNQLVAICTEHQFLLLSFYSRSALESDVPHSAVNSDVMFY